MIKVVIFGTRRRLFINWPGGLTITKLFEKIHFTQPCAVRITEGDESKMISDSYFDTTLIPDDAEVFLIPLTAGG